MGNLVVVGKDEHIAGTCAASDESTLPSHFIPKCFGYSLVILLAVERVIRSHGEGIPVAIIGLIPATLRVAGADELR